MEGDRGTSKAVSRTWGGDQHSATDQSGHFAHDRRVSVQQRCVYDMLLHKNRCVCPVSERRSGPGGGQHVDQRPPDSVAGRLFARESDAQRLPVIATEFSHHFEAVTVNRRH
jgi:hypothetical protein